MKNTIYKIGYLLCAFAIISSCESPEPETNYNPANYEYPVGILLESSNITNFTFDFTYTSNGGGEGYYVVVESGNVPTNQNVFDGAAPGMVAAGSFALTGSPVTTNIGGGDLLCDGTSYDVYAVQFTTDSFLSEATESLSVTTVANNALEGTYDTVTNGFNGWFGIDVTDLLGTVTITDNGDGTFTFDDASGGWYSTYYGQYGATNQTGTMNVPCNSIGGSFGSQFIGCCGDVIIFDGFINLDGTITVHWENTFFEDSADVIYTKQ